MRGRRRTGASAHRGPGPAIGPLPATSTRGPAPAVGPGPPPPAGYRLPGVPSHSLDRDTALRCVPPPSPKVAEDGPAPSEGLTR